MRRLFLVIAAVALLVPAAADAAKPKVIAGAAHLSGGQVQGWFSVEATGPRRSQSARVAVSLGDGHVARVIGRRTVPSLAPGARRRVRFAAPLPAALPSDRWRIRACLPAQCLRLGEFTSGGHAEDESPSPGAPKSERESSPGAGKSAPGAKGSPSDPGDLTDPDAPPATGSPTGPESPPDTDPPPPVSTLPTDPLPYVAGEPFEVTDGAVPYWTFVPETYDESNLTPAPLLVWLHGCGGYSEGDIWVVDPGEEADPPQDWLTIAIGGREGDCWVPSVDEARVMAALADVETHFNVDRQRVILGGYSSGGDLAYRTGFRHSSSFAGLLIENSSPFRDTESSAAESLGAATTKLPIVHLAHTGDTTYPLAGVEREVGEVAAAGFPIELIKRPGQHYDSHTDSDLRELLLPHIDDGRQG
jgi:hypothetical protein